MYHSVFIKIHRTEKQPICVHKNQLIQPGTNPAQTGLLTTLHQSMTCWHFDVTENRWNIAGSGYGHAWHAQENRTNGWRLQTDWTQHLLVANAAFTPAILNQDIHCNYRRMLMHLCFKPLSVIIHLHWCNKSMWPVSSVQFHSVSTWFKTLGNILTFTWN